MDMKQLKASLVMVVLTAVILFGFNALGDTQAADADGFEVTARRLWWTGSTHGVPGGW